MNPGVPIHINNLPRERDIIIRCYLHINNILILEDRFHRRCGTIVLHHNLYQVVLELVLAAQNEVIEIDAVHSVASLLGHNQLYILRVFGIEHVQFQFMNPRLAIQNVEFTLVFVIDVDVLDRYIRLVEETRIQSLH